MEGITSLINAFFSFTPLEKENKTKGFFWYVLRSQSRLWQVFHINFQVQIYISLHSFAFTGYVLIAGFFSFVLCYKHGPLVDEKSICLLTWTLQLLSLFLIYGGATVPQFAYAVMILMLLSRNLHRPVKAFSYMMWYASFFLINVTFWALVLFIVWGNTWTYHI